MSGIPDYKPHIVVFGKSKSGRCIFSIGDGDGVADIATKMARLI